MTQAGRALGEALIVMTGTAATARTRSVAWASMELRGERHCIRMTIEGADAANIAARLVRKLPAHQFATAGMLIADIAGTVVHIGDTEAVVEIEALTLA